MNPVVIDTNCLLQIIARKSPYRPIWDAFIAGRFDLCVSNEILDEYQEILEQQITPTVAENVVMLILNQENVQLVDPHFRMGIITADPDDKGGAARLPSVSWRVPVRGLCLCSRCRLPSVRGQSLQGAAPDAIPALEPRYARRVHADEARQRVASHSPYTEINIRRDIERWARRSCF